MIEDNDENEGEAFKIIQELVMGDKKRRLEELMKIPLDTNDPNMLKNMEETTTIFREMGEFMKRYPKITDSDHD